MSDEISLDGKQYVSSKRASELSGYTQDYIGQLARGGHIDAQRIGGLWYVFLESLNAYKEQAEQFKPEPPKNLESRFTDPDSLVAFDGKSYVSANHAAKLTGYHQDYVGQLARTGKIVSRQVGNRWYVDRAAILAHKEEKDRLLGAVQAQSVGITTPAEGQAAEFNQPIDEESFFSYTREQGDLLPSFERHATALSNQSEDFSDDIASVETNRVPIRVLPESPKVSMSQQNSVRTYVPQNSRRNRRHASRKTIFYGTTAAIALTVVVVLSLGVKPLKMSSIYTINDSITHGGLTHNAFTASAASAIGKVGDVLETWLSPDLVYKKAQ